MSGIRKIFRRNYLGNVIKLRAYATLKKIKTIRQIIMGSILWPYWNYVQHMIQLQIIGRWLIEEVSGDIFRDIYIFFIFGTWIESQTLRFGRMYLNKENKWRRFVKRPSNSSRNELSRKYLGLVETIVEEFNFSWTASWWIESRDSSSIQTRSLLPFSLYSDIHTWGVIDVTILS